MIFAALDRWRRPLRAHSSSSVWTAKYLRPREAVLAKVVWRARRRLPRRVPARRDARGRSAAAPRRRRNDVATAASRRRQKTSSIPPASFRGVYPMPRGRGASARSPSCCFDSGSRRRFPAEASPGSAAGGPTGRATENARTCGRAPVSQPSRRRGVSTARPRRRRRGASPTEYPRRGRGVAATRLPEASSPRGDGAASSSRPSDGGATSGET